MPEDKIIFEFQRADGQSMTVQRPGYHIVDYDGLEATDYDLVTEDNVNYIGARLKRTKVLPRDITIQFAYMGPDKSAERDRLIGFFSPFSSGRLYITYRELRRQVQYEISAFQYEYKAFAEPLVGTLVVKCLDPALLSDITESEIISTWMDGWVWRFTLPFRLRRRGNRTTTILNDGHMSTPVEIDFYGPAENPRVTNETTGEYIQVNRSLGEDDVLHITTSFGNKTVVIEHQGVQTNAFHYIDLDTTFFELQLGENLISYDTDNDLEPQGVEIRYRKRYLGI